MIDTSVLLDAEAVAEAGEEHPWLQVLQLPGQHAVLRDPSQIRLFRGPQQAIGKTWAGAMDLIGFTTGLHPWCDPSLLAPFPINAWVITGSWSQSVSVQSKIWQLIPKHLLHPADAAKYSEGAGWGIKDPRFRIRHKSGGWSLVRIKTSRQGGLSLSSASLHYAWFDEPPVSQRVFSEVHKRILKAGRFGRMILTMTPINAPVEYLRVEVEEGGVLGISDHHHRLEASELVPVGHAYPIVCEDGTPCDAEWVADARAKTLPHEVPVVCDGEFRMAAASPVFTAFSPSHHVVDTPPSGQADVYMGLDYGTRVHAQAGIVVAVSWPDGRHQDPVVDVLAEASGDGDTTDDDDAAAVYAALESAGLIWSNLTAAYGDIPHYGAGKIALKSNRRLMLALGRHPRATAHGQGRQRVTPPINAAKRGAAGALGAAEYGATWLHRLMLQPGRFRVHRRCQVLIEALKAYDLRPNTNASHSIDALRYALKALIYSSRPLPGRTGRLLRG